MDDPHNQNLTGEFMDLTAHVSDGLVFFDLPEGVYRIFTFYTKTVADQHMDTMNPDSVDVLINEVYETHYAHYKDYFGNVFQGFFSDEPFLQRDTVLALRGDYAPKGMTYPWNDLLREKFSEKLGEDCRKYLPAIWAPTAGVSPKVRTAYMDAVTELYNTHFNKRVADWCHAHGVRYIGQQPLLLLGWRPLFPRPGRHGHGRHRRGAVPDRAGAAGSYRLRALQL